MNGFYEKMKLKSKIFSFLEQKNITSFCLNRLQNLRIELLEKMLKDNETRRHDASIDRINRQWSKKQIERENFVKANRLHYLRGKNSFLFQEEIHFIFVAFI